MAINKSKMTSNSRSNQPTINKWILRRNRNSYTCNQCDHKSTNKEALSEHKRTIHEEKLVACDQCEYNTTNKDDMKRHVWSTHEHKRLSHVIKEGEPNKTENLPKGENEKVTEVRPIFPLNSNNLAKNCDKIEKSAKRKLGLIYEATSIINSPSKRTNLKNSSSKSNKIPNHANELQDVTSKVKDTGPRILTKTPSKLVSSAVEKVQ